MYEYTEKIIEAIKLAQEKNAKEIEIAIDKFVENIENDKIIHTFGTGHSHMVGIELFARAGGLGNVDAMLDPDVLTSFGSVRSGAIERTSGVADVIYDCYDIKKGDIMIITSNSGRNAMPIEMAMRCKKEGVYVIVLTCLEQSKATTSRHSSGKKLYEFADLVIDTCLPTGDALMDVEGIKTGPGSSIVTMSIVNTIATEAMKKVCKDGKRPYVYQSQNVDGADNDYIVKKFKGRVKHIG